MVVPMAIGAIENKHGEPNEDHVEEIKGMSAGMENTTWFFGQVLFVGGSGALLVQSTLKNLGYEVDRASLAKVKMPVAIFALIVASVVYVVKDNRLSKSITLKRNIVWRTCRRPNFRASGADLSTFPTCLRRP